MSSAVFRLDILVVATILALGVFVYGPSEPAPKSATQIQQPQEENKQPGHNGKKSTKRTNKKKTKKNKPKIVTVKSNDSLIKIAKRQNTSAKRIFNANPTLKNPDMIKPGDKLRIPKANEKLKDRYSKVLASMEAKRTKARAQKRKVASQPAPRSTATTTSKPKPSPTVSRTKPKSVTTARSSSAGVWDRLADCESSGNWSINTGNGYYGGLQFSLSSWRAVGGSGYPHQASKSEQIKRAEILRSAQGWGAWPSCSAKLGLR